MGPLNHIHLIFLAVALIAIYTMAEFYYDIQYGPEAEGTGVNLHKTYTGATTDTSFALSNEDEGKRGSGSVKSKLKSSSSSSSSTPSPKATGSSGSTTSSKSSRPLITYAYSETENARGNMLFFLSQGLHDGADFVFILNGDTEIEDHIPRRDNIAVVKRNNTCYDLGSHGEVLREGDLWKQYSRFIVLNASIRGPFLPYWSRACWSDAYLNRLTDKVKLVGMTANCWPTFHIQSMIWATDSVGMEIMLYKKRGVSDAAQKAAFKAVTNDDDSDRVALQGCYSNRGRAIGAEVGATSEIRDAGYDVDALMAAFHKASPKLEDEYGDSRGSSDKWDDYAGACATGDGAPGDVLWEGQYFGTNVHPYETVFIKANRNLDPVTLSLLTDWHLSERMGNGSWDVCSPSY